LIDLIPTQLSDCTIGTRAGFNWWEAWGPVYLGGTERLQQLYD